MNTPYNRYLQKRSYKMNELSEYIIGSSWELNKWDYNIQEEENEITSHSNRKREAKIQAALNNNAFSNLNEILDRE